MVILVIGCAAKVDEAPAETKEPVKKETAPVKEQVVQKQETAQEPAETTTKIEKPEVTEAIVTLEVGESRRVDFEDKRYNVKLLSVSNRAQFNVNGEQTKDLILNGVHTFRDQSTLQLLELLYNSAKIKIKLAPEREPIEMKVLEGAGPQTLTTAIFQSVDKRTVGSAEIIRTAEGPIVLQLHNFVTEPGASLYIYLVTNNVNDGLEVARLTTISGGQSYDLPDDIDLNNYNKIIVYSKSSDSVYGEARI